MNEVKMINKKQSSVDWLISQITDDQMVKSKSLYEWLEIFEKAKAMHSQDVKNSQMDMFNLKRFALWIDLFRTNTRSRGLC